MNKSEAQFKEDFEEVTGFAWEDHPDRGFKEMAYHLWSAGKDFGENN